MANARKVKMPGGVCLIRGPFFCRSAGQDVAGHFAIVAHRGLDEISLMLSQCLQAVEYDLIGAGQGCGILAVRLKQRSDVVQRQSKINPRFGQACVREWETGNLQ